MQDLVNRLASLLTEKDMKLTCAESCTGGLLAATITDRPGASKFFDRGFVTYSDTSKSEILDVPANIIMTHGAVSAEVAEAMAAGALKKSRADLSVSITGIAGPDGGSTDKPAGLVWFGYAYTYAHGNIAKTEHRLFSGDRRAVRIQSVETALKGLLSIMDENS